MDTKNRKKIEGYHNRKKPITILSEDIIELANTAQDRIDKNFCSFVVSENLRNVDVLEQMTPILSYESQVSKMLSGDQRVPIGVCVILHYVYGVDLNEFIAGSKPDDAPTLLITPAEKKVLEGLLRKLL